LVVLAIRIEVLKHTNASERISDCVEKEDGNDEEGKHFISKTSGILENSVEIDKGSNDQIHSDPDTNPRVECEEGNAQGIGKLKANRLKGKNGTSTSVDAHGHTTDEGVNSSIPTSRQHEFNCTHVVSRTAAVDGTEGNGRRNGGNIHEKLRNGEVTRVRISTPFHSCDFFWFQRVVENLP
jgi:hypothetical protein